MRIPSSASGTSARGRRLPSLLLAETSVPALPDGGEVVDVSWVAKAAWRESVPIQVDRPNAVRMRAEVQGIRYSWNNEAIVDLCVGLPPPEYEGDWAIGSVHRLTLRVR